MRACSGTWIAHGSRVRRPRSGGRPRPGRRAAGASGVSAAPRLAHARSRKPATTTASRTKASGRCATSPTSARRSAPRTGSSTSTSTGCSPRAVVQESKSPDPIVLVQDYHFALLPRMIQEELPAATIITFWHIPWPNPEAFGICPWREELLDGLLGSSILGFHTQFHCNNFVDTVDRLLEARVDRETFTVSYRGKLTAVKRYPISVEWPPAADLVGKPVERCRLDVRERHHLPPDHAVGVGIDRLDYTKGIEERFRAVERLFELRPEWIGKFTFIQVAAPTRTSIEQYQEYAARVRAMATRINARFPHAGAPPIVLTGGAPGAPGRLRVLSSRRPVRGLEPARRHESRGQGVRLGAGRRARRPDPQPVHRRGARAAGSDHRQPVRHRPVRHGPAPGPRDAGGRAARPHAADARAGPGVQRVSLGGPHADRRRRDAAARSSAWRTPPRTGRRRSARPRDLTRSRPRRERHDRRPDRFGGRNRLDLLPALRRRPRVLLAAATARPRAGVRVLRRGPDRPRGPRAGIPRQHADPRDAAARQAGRRHRDHRLRPALPPVRPDVLPHDRWCGRSGASPATRACACGSVRPTTAAPRRCPPPAAATTSATSAPTSCCGSPPMPPSRRSARRTPFFLDDTDHAAARPGRDGAGRGRGRGAALRRRDHRVLARMGALPRHPLRMAGRRDPRRHHAEAQRLRGHGRDDRRDDHLDPRGGGHGTDLGLPLLLAARRLFRRQRPEPPRRHAHDGALPELHRQRRRRRARGPAAAGVRHQRPAGAGRADRRLTRRLSRHGPGAGRQPGRPAGAARRVRLGDSRRDPRVLRPPPGASRRSRCCSPASRRWASARRTSTTGPTPASGSCAAPSACTPSPA